MKTIDQTPFFDKDGKISMMDQAKVVMRFGSTWVQETRAQQVVVAALDKMLDKSYTLLRNVTLVGLGISIPLILVGPTGIYAIYVTHLRGMYRAKGDIWETISGNTFKPASTNLLTRTARMARAVQVYLQRQGYEGLGDVEAALLCADPGAHVDSIRSIVRVVQSDALERFAVSISQARVVMTAEAVHDIVGRITNPRPIQPPQPAGTPLPITAPTAASKPEEEPYVPAFALLGNEVPSTAQVAPESLSSSLGFDFKEEAAAQPMTHMARPVAPVRPQVRKVQRRFTAVQWGCLIFAILAEISILVAFYFVIRSF